MFDATPQKIANGIEQILTRPEKREHILKGCRKTKELLAESNCAIEVANIINKELTENIK
jgi:lipid A disaccharide synthetase